MIPIAKGEEMMNQQSNSQWIIDTKVGNVINTETQDRVVLMGKYPYKESNYAENLQVIVQPEGETKTSSIKIPYTGYAMQLFLGDFTGDGKDEIMVRGAFGGSGGYEIAAIYTYQDGKFIQIFNQDVFNADYYCNAMYAENYKVDIMCGNKHYKINIADRPKVYLDMVYTQEGQVKPYTEPVVSALNSAYPIKSIYNPYYNLLIQQRIIGVANSDTLGAIQTMVDLKDGQTKIISKNLLTFGEEVDEMRMVTSLKEELMSKVPLGAKAIPLGKREQDTSFIIADLDGDHQEEIIFAYELGGSAYLSIFKHIDNQLRVVNHYKGKGNAIKDFDIIPFKNKKDVLVGWQMREGLGRLEVLEVKNNSLVNTIKNILPPYEILETKDFNEDGHNEIVLWIPQVGNAYDIQIYERNGNTLKPTQAYNKIYYPKVKTYYEKNLEAAPDSSISLYYLADTQYKLEEYEEVEKIIARLLEIQNPYPSLRVIKRLQELTKKKLIQS